MKRICCIETGKTFKSAVDLSSSLGRGRCFASRISANLAKNNLFKYENLTYEYLLKPIKEKVKVRVRGYKSHKSIICNETGDIFKSASELARSIRNGTLSSAYGGWICKKIKEEGVYEDLETGLTYNFTSEKDTKPTSDDKDSSYISIIESLAIQMVKDKEYNKAIKLLNVLI